MVNVLTKVKKMLLPSQEKQKKLDKTKDIIILKTKNKKIVIVKDDKQIVSVSQL